MASWRIWLQNGRRRSGFGWRLGAQPGGLVWLFLKNGIALAAIGATIGLVASFITPACPG